MKKALVFVSMLGALLVAGVACSSQPEKTIANLKAAIEGETQANANYVAFSLKAAEEGNHNIAKLFAATARAEAIHVANHQAVLAQYNISFTATPTAVETQGTIANLEAAIQGETYETTTMYPTFLQDAETEKVAGAIQSFKWALGAETLHAQLYGEAMTLLATEGTDANVSTAWHVCPKCGFIYKSVVGVDHCELCHEDIAKFELF